MISYDFPPILKYLCAAPSSCTYANFYAMRSNQRRVTRLDERRELERNTHGVVSRHKLHSCEVQKSIAITIAIRYSRSGEPVGYMMFAGEDRTYCAIGIVERRVLVARRRRCAR